MTGQPDGSPSAAPEPAEGCEDTFLPVHVYLPTKDQKGEGRAVHLCIPQTGCL